MARKRTPLGRIETWDESVFEIYNKIFPPSKTTNLKNKITRFQQKFDETFYEAWDRFNDLLRGCPHHGFSELHQLDTFYNALNSNDQDSLNSAAGGIEAEESLCKCGKIQLPADFVVWDFEPDPRVPLILGRCFLKTSHALIDVYEGEITLRVGKEAITFNLDQTSKYTADYNHMTVNKIDVIDMACDEYSQEVLGFSNVIATDSFLALEDDPTSSEVDPTYQDPEGDILILEAILNTKTVESSVNEPPEVELKELPPHLEYAFLEGDDKLPVIIAKDLKDEEKAALLKVLKSHKRAIAWKLSDIKGVSPEFCKEGIVLDIKFKVWTDGLIELKSK
ncbi:reverse transcriptase domain-containing protein [Tanacetum coccineum]